MKPSLLVAALLPVLLFATPVRADDWQTGEQLFGSADYAAAKKLFTRLAADKARGHEAQHFLARIALREGDLDAAEDILEELIEAHPNNAKYQLSFGNMSCAQAQQANLISAASYAGDCREAYEKALKLDPKLVDAHLSLFGFYMGAPSMVGGGIDKAKKQAETLMAVDAIEGKLAQSQITLKETRDYQPMVTALQEAIAARPDKPGYRYTLASVLSGSEKWDEANTVLTQLQSDFPDEIKVAFDRGRLAAASGKYLGEGETALKTYIASDSKKKSASNHTWAKFWLAQIYRHQKNEAAEKALLVEVAKDNKTLKSEKLEDELKKLGIKS